MVVATRPRPKPFELWSVVTMCLKCKDLSTVEAFFVDGKFKEIVNTRHIHQVGRNHCYCWCGGEVKFFIPSRIPI